MEMPLYHVRFCRWYRHQRAGKGTEVMWFVFALLSAVFAALTSILATGASWLCYYRALQIGEASRVVPIDKLSVVITLVLAFLFLHEEFTAKSLAGCVLIGAGTLVMVL